MVMKFLRRSPSLPPAPEGEHDYWALAHVVFPEPKFVDDDEEPGYIAGYYRNFGIRARPEDLPAILEKASADGRIDWSGTEWHEVDWRTIKKWVLRQINYVAGQPIWYESGHVFYSPEPEDEPPLQ